MNYNTGETTEETFTYDAAGNIVTTTDEQSDSDGFTYDTNNRLIEYNGNTVTYDADGNMTSAYHDGSRDSFRYDSTNRLIGTNTNAYTYNAENVRIRNLCGESETTYVYNTNAKLSSMLMKTTDGVVTKYVYGRGLIGEETNGVFKTYHFDYRGSTVAITDINGNVTDRFEYDTYGKLTSRTGNSDVIFLYNGRDGVVTDANGLIYMRARYYSPELRRFVNADILAGRIDNAVTLNRYAYANGNPVALVDPSGLSADERNGTSLNSIWSPIANTYALYNDITNYAEMYEFLQDSTKYGFYTVKAGDYINIKGARTAVALDNDILGTRYAIKNADDYWDVFKNIDVKTGLKSELYLKTPSGKINGGAVFNYLGVAVDVVSGIAENIDNETRTQKIVSDAVVDVGVGVGIIAASTAIGSAIGSVVPVAGNVVGAVVGMAAGYAIDWAVNKDFIDGKSAVDWTKEGAGWVADRVVDAGKAIGDFFAGIFD